MFTRDSANDSGNNFNIDLAIIFSCDFAIMFIIGLPNMFASAFTTMFTSDLVNMFSSDFSNMFTSELETCKKLIWPICSLAKLTCEYAGLVPGTWHVIPMLCIYAICYYTKHWYLLVPYFKLFCVSVIANISYFDPGYGSG